MMQAKPSNRERLLAEWNTRMKAAATLIATCVEVRDKGHQKAAATSVATKGTI